jgi:hypothetical protein
MNCAMRLIVRLEQAKGLDGVVRSGWPVSADSGA